MNMPKGYILFLLTFLLVITYGPFSFAQHQLDYTKLTRKDGLSSNTVYSFFQDEKGFIWIGTANGLDVYDGIRFHHFNGTEAHPIPLTAITQVLKDKKGNLWIVNDNKVGIFNTQFLSYNAVTVKTINQKTDFNGGEYCLWTDSRNNLFLTIPDYGLLKYDEETKTFSEKGIPFRIPVEWGVRQVLEDSVTGNYWIASNNGVAMYDFKRKELLYNKHNPSKINLFNEKIKNIAGILLDSSGKCWIVSKSDNQQNLYAYNFKDQSLVSFSGALSLIKNFFRIDRLFSKKNGLIWAYGYGALLNQERKSDKFSNIESAINGDGLNYTNVYKVFEDRENNTWIATDAGIYILHAERKQAFIVFPPNNAHLLIANIFHSSDDKLMVSTWGQGIQLLDSNFHWQQNSFYNDKNIKDSNYKYIMGLYQDKVSKNIWACCQGGRLIIYNESANKIRYLHPKAFRNSDFRFAKEDKQGNLWFNAFNGDVVKWTKGDRINNDNFKVIQSLNSKIWTQIIDKSGLLWFGTLENGLYVMDPSTGKIIHHYDQNGIAGKSLFNNYVLSINQYNDSIFFINSGALNILNANTGNIRQITSNNGLPFNKMLVTELDRKGYLWITTSDAMYKYDYTRNILTDYSEEDGFSNTNLLNESTILLEDGTLLFGGTDNILVFNPDKSKPSDAPPDVVISQFQLFSKYLPVDSLLKLKQLRLNYDQNTFTIYFSSLSFSQRNNISYYYRLQGLDREWTKANSLAYCNFNSLTPGHYTLLLKAVNNEGVSSAGVTSFAIYISPPFWSTWWFTTLIVLCLSAIVYYIYRIRINRLLAIQAIRAKVARDLHDDVGSTLTTIGILSEIAKTKTSADAAQTRELIEKISDNSSRMMGAMGDIVWSINPANDSMKKIIARMREYAVTLLEAKGIEFSFKVAPSVEQLALSIEARLDFYLIFKEGVNNLVKYGRCTYVEMEILHRQGSLWLRVKDNGAGFDMNNYKRGNGLANMRKRAKNIGALIEVQSAPGQGTTITLNVPLAKS